MDFSIGIDRGTCIKCERCVKVCPSRIFQMENKTSFPEAVHPETCILCGHCVDACPTDSVLHTEFPPEKVHKIKREIIPGADSLMMLLKSRRSNRAFTDKKVPAEMLDTIVEAAATAPTASNAQQMTFTVITDPEKIEYITQYTLAVFSAVEKKLTNPVLKPVLNKIIPGVYKMIPAFEKLRLSYRNGYDGILRGAKAVIFISAPESNRFGAADANLAYQNGSLMAEALGVSQFYTGFVCAAIKQDKKHDLNKAFGIKGKIHAGMALGMPEFKYPKYSDRKPADVKKL